MTIQTTQTGQTKMIKELIKNNRLRIFFQPIISIMDKKIFAYEALTRGFDEHDEIIMPLFLFNQAKKEDLSNELDTYVRKLAITEFQKYYEEDKKLLLFLNFESSIIDNDTSDDFINFVLHHKISPSNIVIEIKEDSIKNNKLLNNFVKKYREHGFIIAIDDFGTGHSSFDRLALIQPDIVKVDRSIIYDVDKNFINSEILQAITNMCHKIGTLVLAEGVETKDEILSCMTKDIDIFQGFWFSKPKKEIDETIKETLLEKIQEVGCDYQSSLKNLFHKEKLLLKDSKALVKTILSIMQNESTQSITKIHEIILKDPKLEAIFLLNENTGKQFGATILDKREERKMFSPTKDGHDHSLKEYYFITKDSSRGDYLSAKYISKATGNMCRTYSAKISLKESKYIVCFDILE